MVKHRVERLNKEIQKEISDILAIDIKDPRLGMVSVIDVDTTGDYSISKIYISPLVGKESDTMAALKSASPFIRRLLAQRLTIRKVPELEFIADNSIEEGFKITQILDDYNKNNK